MSKRIYDDEPTTQRCTGETRQASLCGPKDEPCVCQQIEFDFMSEPTPGSSDLLASPEPDSKFDPSPASKIITIEDRRRYMEELDRTVFETLVSIVKSGEATPGHLKVAVQYLKDKGYTLPEMAKRERIAKDQEFLGDIDLPFNA